jgi:hypothetical protein
VSTPRGLRELQEKGPFTDAGPHRIETHIPAPSTLRGGAGVRLVIRDTGSGEVVYHATTGITVHAASTIEASALVEVYADAAWAGNVIVDPLIEDEQVKADVLIPAGYTVEITYLIDGLAT